MTSNKIDDWALHAYVDNEVSNEQRAEVEQQLRTDPDLAQKVEAWRRQRRLMKEAYDGALAEPLPSSLAAALRTGGGLAERPYLAMAAAVALLLIGGIGGWTLAAQNGASDVAGIARDALSAHQVYAAEVRHPVEVKAEERAHLQAWLSKRVGQPFIVPDLDSEGYTLLGGRLVASGERPAALLMYEDARANRISILLTSRDDESETALHVEQRGDLIACYWRDGKLAFAVAGQMARDPMMKLAAIIYERIEG